MPTSNLQQIQEMKISLRFTKLLVLASALLSALCLPGAVHGQITLTPTITDAGGGLFSYQYSVRNTSLFDFSAISIEVIPESEAVQSLVAPIDFSAFFDPGLGQVDFVEDAQNFAAGMTVGGFSFTSPFEPQPSTFTALRFDENTGDPVTFTGSVLAPQIPEPASVLFLGVGLAGLATMRTRRRGLVAR